MSDPMPIAQAVRIRDCGFDEYWLQRTIADNPGCLGLGDLDLIAKERRQSSGGRLDILLKNPDDDTMYEVEVMLGETDESHIIRTLEYWGNERKKWPKRQHIAVLVAESITSRFFNVIHLLSNAIPIIAVQVSIVEAGGQKALHFAKVIDTYEEPEEIEAESSEIHDEEYWRAKALWTLEAAKALLKEISPVYGSSASLNFVKTFIAVRVGANNHFWFNKRNGNKSRLGFRISDELMDKATVLLDESRISYVRKTHSLRITIDKAMIESTAETLRKIAVLVKETWES